MKPEVNAEVFDLPNHFDDIPEDYFDFISNHATHFFSVGDFGGKVKQVSSTEVSFYRTNSIENAAEGNFNYTLKSLGVEVDNFTFNEKFVAQSSVITSYYGGSFFVYNYRKCRVMVPYHHTSTMAVELQTCPYQPYHGAQW